MNTKHCVSIATFVGMSLLTPTLVRGQSSPAAQDWSAVESALGRKGAAQPADVMRFNFPRRDLRVTVGDVAVRPALALGSWVAFRRMGNGTMVMGDLVLLESEIKPVMTKMIDSGIEITAVHNHLLRASPATFYMHILGHGDPEKLARAIHDGLAASATPLTSPASPASPQPVDLDTAQLEQTIGAKAQSNGGVLQFSVPRSEPITEDDMPITPPGPTGVATGINFQPTGNGKAAITGDFVLTGDEVNPVIKALRSNGIEVTALHSHMLTERPRLFFMHFWANDDAQKLARGLAAALSHVATGAS